MGFKPPYQRVLLKLSGETLRGNQPFGIVQEACLQVAHSLSFFHKAGIELGVVIGGGNIFRGLDFKSSEIQQTPADQMGMLATLFNGIALQQALMSIKVPVSVMSALDCPKIAESYNWAAALRYLKEGKVVIFVGGTGNPYFTTDTAAALRASEMGADVLVKATKVDGVYNRDPLKDPLATKYETVSYSQFLAEKLNVMDETAVILCQKNRIPIHVINMKRLFQEPLEDILTKVQRGTWISEEEKL